MCSQQPALDGCTILAWTGNTMVETAAEIIAKSSSFSVSRIEPIIQLAAYRRNAAAADCSCPILGMNELSSRENVDPHLLPAQCP
jgi:hypothetical protein